jgi:hypothetical protein
MNVILKLIFGVRTAETENYGWENLKSKKK